MRSLPLFMLVGLSLAGCDAGVQCAVDTDCVLGNYCSESGACLPLGTGGDGGRADGGSTDGGPRDAMVSDARIDAAPTDAPMSTDAPATCPDVAGDYTVTSIDPGCGGLTATTITVSGPAPSECAFEVAVDATGVGTLAQDDGTDFSGTLNVGGSGVACTASFVEGASVTITCGTCVIAASAT